MHNGQPQLFISDQRAWLHGIYTVGSLCSSFQIYRAWYIKPAQWVVPAPHFGPREPGFKEYAEWAVSAPYFRSTVVLKIIQPPLLFPMTSIETSRATLIDVLTVCFRSIKYDSFSKFRAYT